MRQYASSYRLWRAFCQHAKLKVYQVTPHTLINFLQYLLETKGHGYSAFNTHRAALALLTDSGVGAHPDVCRFLRSIFKTRPSGPRYTSAWDPAQVLDFFRQSHTDSLQFLSRKLLILLLLATGQRMQTLRVMTRDNISFQTSQVIIRIPQLIKTSRPGAVAPVLYLPFLPEDQAICVPSCLRKYLEATSSWASPRGSLFLTTKGSHGPASGPTLARWVRDVFKWAKVDVDVFRPHSTRHAAVSKAARQQVPVDAIFAAAGWSSRSQVFQKYYNRPLSQQSEFARAVLS